VVNKDERVNKELNEKNIISQKYLIKIGSKINLSSQYLIGIYLIGQWNIFIFTLYINPIFFEKCDSKFFGKTDEKLFGSSWLAWKRKEKLKNC